MKACEDLMISRTLVPASLQHAAIVELHTFSDASELAIAAVSYVRVVSKDESRHTGFVIGKAKVAPKQGTTIPRLELCAAVLAVEVAEFIQRNLDHPLDNSQFYSDSKVVLGYITHQNRRFYVYVANRVQRIRKYTIPEQWKYVQTQKNPADLATRPILADNLKDSLCYSGPQEFLDKTYLLNDNSYPLVNPVKDNKLRPPQDPCILKTNISTYPTGLGSHRFQIFSNWRSLIRAIAFLILHIRNRSGKNKSV